MSITSSSVTVEAAQKDGRKWVHETHVDNIGLQWWFDYLTAPGTDVNAVLAARAPVLAQQLVDQEVAANIDMIELFGAEASPTFKYSTKLQQAPALRAAYKDMTHTEAVFTGEFLAGFTDAQLAAAFNIPIAQVATLRTNQLTPAVNTAADIRATTGV
jgi:hypothetical protein